MGQISRTEGQQRRGQTNIQTTTPIGDGTQTQGAQTSTETSNEGERTDTTTTIDPAVSQTQVRPLHIGFNFSFVIKLAPGEPITPANDGELASGVGPGC